MLCCLVMMLTCGLYLECVPMCHMMCCAVSVQALLGEGGEGGEAGEEEEEQEEEEEINLHAAASDGKCGMSMGSAVTTGCRIYFCTEDCCSDAMIKCSRRDVGIVVPAASGVRLQDWTLLCPYACCCHVC